MIRASALILVALSSSVLAQSPPGPTNAPEWAIVTPVTGSVIQTEFEGTASVTIAGFGLGQMVPGPNGEPPPTGDLTVYNSEGEEVYSGDVNPGIWSVVLQLSPGGYSAELFGPDYVYNEEDPLAFNPQYSYVEFSVVLDNNGGGGGGPLPPE